MCYMFLVFTFFALFLCAVAKEKQWKMRSRAAVKHSSTQQYIMPRTWPVYVYVYVYDLLCSQAKYIVGQKQLFLGVA